MDKQEQKVVYAYFIHKFLRTLGKRYPEFFVRWVTDSLENLAERRVLIKRYTGDTQMKFESIAYDLGMDASYMFRYHKRAVERLISQ